MDGDGGAVDSVAVLAKTLWGGGGPPERRVGGGVMVGLIMSYP